MEQTNNYYAPEPQTTVCGKIPLSMRYASLALRTRLHWHVPLCVPSAEFTLLIDQREQVWSHVVKIPVTSVFSVLLNIIKGIINYVYICFVTNSYAFMLFMSFPCLYHEKLGYYIGWALFTGQLRHRCHMGENGFWTCP